MHHISRLISKGTKKGDDGDGGKYATLMFGLLLALCPLAATAYTVTFDEVPAGGKFQLLSRNRQPGYRLRACGR